MIAEISSPDSFYFDGTGVLRRVTSSIFDDRGNVAQREALKKERHARFRFRQAEADARLAALRPKVRWLRVLLLYFGIPAPLSPAYSSSGKILRAITLPYLGVASL